MHPITRRLPRPPLRHRRGKILQHAHGSLPIYAGIRDGDALLEAGGTLRRNLLVALVDVGLDHYADDAGFAVADLLGDVGGDLGLVAVVFVGVAWDMLGSVLLYCKI